MAVTISEKPWSDYTAADYTPEQWHAACLIHQHEGLPTSKNQCKLPVRTPNGTLNRNGVHAAAGALAGARGGVNASSEEKAAAAKALVRFYRQLDEDPPPSLSHSKLEKLENFLVHVGVKGMKWGVRRQRDSGSAEGGGEGKSEEGSSRGHLSVDAERSIKTTMKKTHEMSDREIKEAVNRANMIKSYNDLFGAGANRELRNKVETLNLQKQFAQLNREMNPSKTQRVLRLVKTAEEAYGHYNKLNNASGGTLAKKLEFHFSQSAGAKLARSLEASKPREALLKRNWADISKNTANTLKKNKSLLDEVDELLRVGPDGSVQGVLF